MPFWKKSHNQASKLQSQAQESESTMIDIEGTLKVQSDQKGISIIESDSLGMTIVEDETNFDELKQQLQPLSPEEWIDVIENGSLKGFSFSRIFFSFLKGIPDYLRFKVWIFLCTENSSKKVRFSGKNLPEEMIKQFQVEEGTAFVKISGFDTDLYQQLASMEPMEKEKVQIDKDIHRSYSNKAEFKYTAQLLRKILVALSNSGIEYAQGMNYILLNVMIFCLQSIGVTSAQLFESVTAAVERDIFIILRETVLRQETVFGDNNIFKVVGQLEEKIAETVPEVLFHIYKLGMDCFSMFSQYYFSLLTYNDPPEELCKQMMDLFFLVGEEAIHAIILRMLEVSKDHILQLHSAEQLQDFLKVKLFSFYYPIFKEEKKTATKLSDFGLSFYQRA